MPIRTPRLLIRPKQSGDGATSLAAVIETWGDLHKWMQWAESPSDFTEAEQELRIRQQMASFARRTEFNLLGIERASGRAVIWCGLHDIDWQARSCDTGFWVRKSAQREGFATEATNALLRYAFSALGMRRVGITHSAGNEASHRVVEKLGFSPESILQNGNPLPGGRLADRCCYARLDLHDLPPLHVQWGGNDQPTASA